MTPQEQQMIDGLIGRIRTAPVEHKDAEAEQHIQQGLAGYGDALYVLVQTVLVQQYGLEQAQSQLGELKQQVQTLQEASDAGAQKSSSGSFLSHIFGSGNASAPASPTQQTSYQPVNNPGYGSPSSGGYAPPPPPYQQPGGYQPSGGVFGGGGGMFGGGGGGFMRGALQTAAGVAAGEMVFRGMEDLFQGFGGGHGREFAGGGGGETIVNNYYDEDRGNDLGGDRDTGNDRGFYNPDDDASRNDPGSMAGGSDLDSLGGTDDFSDTGSDDGGFGDSSSSDGSNDDFSS